MSGDEKDTESAELDESVEGHGIKDTGQLKPIDDDVEGHAVNHRPLDNGGTPSH